MRGEALAVPRVLDLSLRAKVTVAIGTLLALSLAVLFGWWLSIQGPPIGRDGGPSIWTLLLAVGIVIVSTAIGALFATAAFAPLSALAAQLREARSAGEASAVIEGLRDPDLRQLLASVMSVVRSVDARTRSRSLFFAALVHDLKGRVAGLSLLTEPWPERGSAEHGLVERELSEVSDWLRRILDALRLDQLEELGERSMTDLRTLVEECVRELSADPDLTVTFEVEGNALAAVDQDEVARALMNLLANAARVSRSTVSVQVFPGLVRIGDDGPGLPRPFEVLVEPFSRGSDQYGSGSATGTGLGLFIAKRVLELHGGRLVCERTGGAGTVLLAYLGANRHDA